MFDKTNHRLEQVDTFKYICPRTVRDMVTMKKSEIESELDG